jgi:hypothetical protein
LQKFCKNIEKIRGQIVFNELEEIGLRQEIAELENLIEDYQINGFKVNQFLLAKLEILKTELEESTK